MSNTKKYDRYASFRREGDVDPVTIVKIDFSQSDIFVTYDRRYHRFDTLSYRYYNDPNYGWLILQANPDKGSLEFNIENGAELRIPYPLDDAIIRYEKAVNKLMTEKNKGG